MVRGAVLRFFTGDGVARQEESLVVQGRKNEVRVEVT